MGRINVLSFDVANLIAAGEVVDRPSSVIKELLENSIDSGARQITVEIKNGGTTYMRVSDDGSGIEADDLPIAIKRHATSKIKTSDDLMKILTLGFRGEALAAISSVSDMRIISKTADASYGAMLEAHSGEITEYCEQAARKGTTVIVENLFANIPARRKFLKRDATEASAIGTIVEKIALSHPEISFRFISDGSVKLDTPGDGHLETVIYTVMGRDMQNGMIYVNGEIDNIGVCGYIGRSDIVKSNRNYQNFFINNRYIKSKLAVAAIEQAYTSYLPPEKFPCCVLNLTINPAIVDINVHPTKLEVKFANEKPVFEAIYHTVKTALEENTTRPEIKIGSSSGAQQRISASQYKTIAEARPLSWAFAPINDKTSRKDDSQIKYSELASDKPDVSVDENDAPRAHVADAVSETVAPSSSDMQAQNTIPQEAIELEREFQEIRVEDMTPSKARDFLYNHLKYFNDHPNGMQDGFDEYDEFSNEASVAQSSAPTSPVDICDDAPATPEGSLNELDVHREEERAEELAPPIPQYRVVGEVFNSYLIVEREEKMLIIDKHAAHERIIFEKNKAMMRSKEPSSQMLISPIEIMLTSAEIAIVNDYRSDFEKLGFKLGTKKYSILVYSIPTELASCDVQDTLTTMISRIRDGSGNAKLTRDILFEKALYQASCKAAIKAGREYVEAHTDWIIEQLMKIPDITFCPHGRPVAMELSKKNLDHQFERT